MKRAALLSTALIIIPTITQAQCVATTDCASLGYTKTSCPNGGLKCPFANYWSCKETTSTSTPTEPEPLTPAVLGECNGYAQKCTVGQILNSDGTCTTNKTSGKTPLGVIIAIKDNCGWAITPEVLGGAIWSIYAGDTSLGNYTTWETAKTDYDACGNTKKITQMGRWEDYPAAWIAANYDPDATLNTQGKWCLPAAGQLNSLYLNLNAVNNALEKIGGKKIVSPSLSCDYLWSSTEDGSYGHAWVFCDKNTSQEGLSTCDKNDRSCYTSLVSVRAVIQF